MDTTELYSLFREDVHDVDEPFLWTPDEVIRYMDAAQKQFCRLSGGIADSTSAVTQVAATTGNAWADVSPVILRFRRASLSDGTEVKIINHENVDVILDTSDYGFDRPIKLDNTTGPVRYMVTNMEANKVRLIKIPTADQTISLSVYRMPLVALDDLDLDLEIDEQHRHYLLLWMKALAYAKQDAETRNDKLREQNDLLFRQYCTQARAEREAREHKTRIVSYGGL